MSQNKIIKALGLDREEAKALRKRLVVEGLKPTGENTAFIMRSALYTWERVRAEQGYGLDSPIDPNQQLV